jgi:hypothetical protein
MIQYRITNERVGNTTTLWGDYSGRVQGLAFATNNRGFAECTGFVPMGMSEAFGLYERIGTLRVQVADSSGSAIYDGRVEDIGITGDGVTITALGYSRALGDRTYTAMWSMSDAQQFRPTRVDEQATRNTELYDFDTNNRILIGLKNNATYGNVADIAGMVYQLPYGGFRQIVGVMFDALITLPANWVFQLNQWTPDYAGVATTVILTSGGAVTQLNNFITFTACEYVEFVVYNSTGGNYTVVDPFALQKVIITNVRVVTATTNMVSTTTTANFTSATPVTVTVASTARMYVGQRLHIGPLTGTANTGCTIASILSATQFTTNIPPATGTFLSGALVRSFVVYADEIAKDLVSITNTLNSNQLASLTTLVTSPAVDLVNETYEDRRPSDVLDYLVKLGDTAGNQWEWGVKADQRLYYRVQGAAARTWYIDVSNLDIRQLIDNLYNSVYAVYQEAGGRTLRTAATDDTTSVARYGMTRRMALAVSTTSAAQAGLQQAAALNDTKNPRPQSGVVVNQVFDATGARWPLWYVAAGDTVVIRNLPPTLSSTIDRIRTFRLARVEYAFASDTLTLEPESPVPSLDAMLSRVLPPSWVSKSWWDQT